MLTGLHAIQLQRDAEIMGTLGAVLSRHAPGRPASIYHRRLVQQVRRLAEPAMSRPVPGHSSPRIGDEAMLDLGDRPTEHFPRPPSGITADYTDVSDDEAVRNSKHGATTGPSTWWCPAPALPWLANHRALDRHLARALPRSWPRARYRHDLCPQPA